MNSVTWSPWFLNTVVTLKSYGCIPGYFSPQQTVLLGMLLFIALPLLFFMQFYLSSSSSSHSSTTGFFTTTSTQSAATLFSSSYQDPWGVMQFLFVNQPVIMSFIHVLIAISLIWKLFSGLFYCCCSRCRRNSKKQSSSITQRNFNPSAIPIPLRVPQIMSPGTYYLRSSSNKSPYLAIHENKLIWDVRPFKWILSETGACSDVQGKLFLSIMKNSQMDACLKSKPDPALSLQFKTDGTIRAGELMLNKQFQFSTTTSPILFLFDLL